MKVLIEEQYYPAEQVCRLCGEFGVPNSQNEIKVSRVGYFFNQACSDCVICLPKVVMFKQNKTYLAFGKYHPKDIVDAFSLYSEKDTINDALPEPAQGFIKEFALWSYRTIATFARLNPKSGIISKSSSAKIDDSFSGTFFDVVFMIIKFYNENKDYIMYIIRNVHSGFDRVDWRKTISKKVPIIQKGSPIYMEVINRKKQVDFDEELMVIFYSILNYISNHLGFDIGVDCNYDLIVGGEFDTYREHLGLTRLRAIKYKYFSDKDLQIWKLCYAFFEKTSNISNSDKCNDYLFVTDFEKVFESMMDALISDKNVHKKLVDQKDGKIIDHIFKHDSPIDGSKVYYIGDSKYYMTEDDIKGTALYKQHTYAKNVIQFHIDSLNKDQLQKTTYRDPVTEGYNFVPNFFIGAYIPNDLSYEQCDVSEQGMERKRSVTMHFHNRLFDRDTLWLKHYNVNLLYVMSLYASDDNFEQSDFKESFKKKIHEGFHEMLVNEYEFFWVTPPEGVSLRRFVEDNFYVLNGRAYIPLDETKRFIVAQEWDFDGDKKISSADSEQLKANLKAKQATIDTAYI